MRTTCLGALALCCLLLDGLTLAAKEEGRADAGEAVAVGTGSEAIESAIRRGVDFLLEAQNRGGSWGSARRTKGLNIYAPVPGAHQAFRAAVTSLAVLALLETAADRDDAMVAVDEAESWLRENLPDVRRATPAAIYNVWAHAYAISALARLIEHRAGEEERQAELRELILGQLDRLERYELVNGGWSYYDFEIGTQKPAGSPTSFTTATVLVALDDVRRLGIEIAPRLVRRAKASIGRQQKPDFSYIYGEYLRWRPMRLVNRPPSSLGRSQACNLALRLWGDERITDAVIREWLERLLDRNGWLDIGRKRPVPHEAWFQVAGYFFYYGHYYAALCLEQLPASERRPYQVRLAEVLLRLQERDGSWWDFPFYDYHQSYGTAYALMGLARCR